MGLTAPPNSRGWESSRFLKKGTFENKIPRTTARPPVEGDTLEHLELDPVFFGPLKGIPLHIAFEVTRGGDA